MKQLYLLKQMAKEVSDWRCIHFQAFKTINPLKEYHLHKDI